MKERLEQYNELYCAEQSRTFVFNWWKCYSPTEWTLRKLHKTRILYL